MALERVPYPGSVDFQYDSLPDLGSRFAIGHRDVEQLTTNHLQPIATERSDRIHNTALADTTSAVTQAQDSVETEVRAC